MRMVCGRLWYDYFKRQHCLSLEAVLSVLGGSVVCLRRQHCRLLKAVQPSAKGEQHLCMVAEAGSYAEAVAAVGIDKERGRHVVAI